MDDVEPYLPKDSDEFSSADSYSSLGDEENSTQNPPETEKITDIEGLKADAAEAIDIISRSETFDDGFLAVLAHIRRRIDSHKEDPKLGTDTNKELDRLDQSLENNSAELKQERARRTDKCRGMLDEGVKSSLIDIGGADEQKTTQSAGNIIELLRDAKHRFTATNEDIYTQRVAIVNSISRVIDYNPELPFEIKDFLRVCVESLQDEQTISRDRVRDLEDRFNTVVGNTIVRIGNQT